MLLVCQGSQQSLECNVACWAHWCWRSYLICHPTEELNKSHWLENCNIYYPARPAIRDKDIVNLPKIFGTLIPASNAAVPVTWH